MNTQALQSLVIDQHFGELSPETADLLRCYLQEQPELNAQVEETLSTLRLTAQAVMSTPQRVPQMLPAVAPRRTLTWLAQAAAVLLLFLTGAGGFLAGKHQTTAQTVALRPSGKKGPWAKYELAYDAKSPRVSVVRIH